MYVRRHHNFKPIFVTDKKQVRCDTVKHWGSLLLSLAGATDATSTTTLRDYPVVCGYSKIHMHYRYCRHYRRPCNTDVDR